MNAISVLGELEVPVTEYRSGYDTWDDVSELSRLDPRFQFDTFFRTRTPGDLSKRSDHLIKYIVKEVCSIRYFSIMALQSSRVATSDRSKKRKTKVEQIEPET